MLGDSLPGFPSVRQPDLKPVGSVPERMAVGASDLSFIEPSTVRLKYRHPCPIAVNFALARSPGLGPSRWSLVQSLERLGGGRCGCRVRVGFEIAKRGLESPQDLAIEVGGEEVGEGISA